MARLIYISQPMKGLKQETIEARRAHATEFLRGRGFDVANPVIEPIYSYASNHPLYCLGQSLMGMAECDGVYFLTGWEEARGCQVEHSAAKKYGLAVFYEEVLEAQTKTVWDAMHAAAEARHAVRVAKTPERVAYAMQRLSVVQNRFMHSVDIRVVNESAGQINVYIRGGRTMEFYAGTGKIKGEPEARGIEAFIHLVCKELEKHE